MITSSNVCLLLSLVLGTFGWWGYYTAAGQKTFDEMSGMIPFFALLVAGVLFLVGLALYAFSRRA